MLTLAAFRYRAVLADAGGPVARLEITDVSVLGQRHFIASAFLAAGLADDPAPREVFSAAHGSGVARSPMTARFIAISEALERWCHWQLHAHPDGLKYGFSSDPSSNGMAAYPGVFRRQARPTALMEASERFNLINWWEGRLPAAEGSTPWPGVHAVTLCSEAPGTTVIVYKQTPAGFVAYGHAAALTYPEACRKAVVEMERHALVVERFALAHAGQISGQLPADAHPIERRSLFFATPAGHELFLEKLRSRSRGQALSPKLIFDGAIPGPWSRYTDVWRVVYELPSDRFLGMEENYFLW